MGIKKRQFDGYYLTQSTDTGSERTVMVLEGPWKDKYKELFYKHDITGLRLSDSAGWKDPDICFLRALPELREIEIYSYYVNEISCINYLQNLQSISLECRSYDFLEFSNFSNLKYFYAPWHKKLDGVFSCSSLETLNIPGYPYEDAGRLRSLSRLKWLQIMSRKLRTLDGIEALTDLNTLNLFECTKLESISGIEALSNLKNIHFINCRRLRSIDPIGKISGVVYLCLDNCGPIESLLPLRDCKEIRKLFFTGDTYVADGNLTFLEHLPNLQDVSFMNRKHYSHKREFFD